MHASSAHLSRPLEMPTASSCSGKTFQELMQMACAEHDREVQMLRRSSQCHNNVSFKESALLSRSNSDYASRPEADCHLQDAQPSDQSIENEGHEDIVLTERVENGSNVFFDKMPRRISMPVEAPQTASTSAEEFHRSISFSADVDPTKSTASEATRDWDDICVSVKKQPSMRASLESQVSKHRPSTSSQVTHQLSTLSVHFGLDEAEEYEDADEEPRKIGSVNHYRIKQIWRTKVERSKLSRFKSFYSPRTMSVIDPESIENRESCLVSKSQNSQDLRSKSIISTSSFASVDPKGSLMQRCVSHPSSFKRLLWDLTAMVLVLYDFVYVPLLLFPIPETDLTKAARWVARSFWTADLFASFCVGYHCKGKVEMHWSVVGCHYLRTWFVPDLAIVLVDWSFYFLMSTEGNADDVAQLGKTFRGLRVIRAVRLLRLVKLKRVVKEMHDRIDSEVTSTYFNVMVHVMIILAINHLVACLWYGVSRWSQDDGNDWVDKHGFGNEPVAFLYTTALHWSLTQFTPASMHVQPHNVMERVFTIIVVMFALVIFSTFVSQITTSTSSLWNKRAYHSKQLWLLRRFLRKNQVSIDVSLRVQRYLMYVVDMQLLAVREEDVQILGLLSEPLKNELKLETYYHLMYEIEFFNTLKTSYNRRVFLKIWQDVIFEVPLALGDALFFSGEPSSHVCCLVTGTLQYKRKWDRTNKIVESGTWACLPSLWVDWVNIGDMRAAIECQMAKVDSAKLAKNICDVPAAHAQAHSYALKFVDVLNQCQREALSDLTMEAWQINATNRTSIHSEWGKMLPWWHPRNLVGNQSQG